MKPVSKTYVSDFKSVDAFYDFARLHGFYVDNSYVWEKRGRNYFGDLMLKPVAMTESFADPHYMFQFILDRIKHNDRKMTKNIWRKAFLSRYLIQQKRKNNVKRN